MSKRHVSETFRALHQSGDLFVMPNPWDVGTARLLESLGFPAIASASAALAITTGRQDGLGQVPRDDAIDHAKMLQDAVDLPLNADLEAGFGDTPEAVAKTIQQAIAAGLAGCSIEDLHVVDGQRQLYDRHDAIERIRAAAKARDAAGSAFVLTARCEAFLIDHPDPLKESIERLAAMAAAGADVVYACGISRRADIATLVRELVSPVNVLGGSGHEPPSIAELKDLGVARVSLGPRLIQAALGGVMRAAEEIHKQGRFGFMTQAADLVRVKKLTIRTDRDAEA